MQRTMLIGLDGATFSVLDHLMDTGVMPFLKSVVSGGVRAPLLSTPNPLTPPAWTSLVTGRTPGHHGIFDFIHSAEGPGGLFFTLNTSFDIKCETIWSVVSRKGGSVSALNFPVSAPPQPVNGNVVPGFVPWRHLRRSVHPPAFYDVMKSLPGFDPKELAMDMVEELKSIQWLPADQHQAWIEHHTRREGQWFRIAKHIIDENPSDLIAVLFDGVDKLQHLFWRYIDPELTSQVATGEEARTRGWCLDYFRQLDAHIAALVQAAGDDARVFFASDHGFGPTSDIFYANTWLEREGYLAWAQDSQKDDLGRMATDRIKSHVVGIDWDKTTAYALTPSSNGIFIRRAAAAGMRGVPPDEYERFRRGLATRLEAVTHPDTGRRFVKKVMTREEAYPGDDTGRSPDLTLVLEDYGFLSVLNSDAILRRRPEPAGTHRPEGVFIASGPGVAGGRSLPPLSIVDVAPVLLHSLGLEVPRDLEGRVPAECYEAGFLKRHPVTIGEATVPPGDARSAGGDDEMSSEDEAVVMERLKSLGYIE